jgi:hypothetical protein
LIFVSAIGFNLLSLDRQIQRLRLGFGKPSRVAQTETNAVEFNAELNSSPRSSPAKQKLVSYSYWKGETR